MTRPLAPLGAAIPLLLLSPLAVAQTHEPAPRQPVPGSSEPLPARVDERIELLSIVCRLAGMFEYHQNSATSRYSDEVDHHFGPFVEHDAVRMALRLRQEHGLSFDAVPWFALRIRWSHPLEPVVKFDDPELRFERGWSADTATEFLAALQRFADESDAFQFMEDHHDFYAAAAQRLQAELVERPYRDWLDEFFGARPGADFCAIVGLLNGGASYGMHTQLPGHREQITPIIGAHRFDDESLPIFSADDATTVAHEFAHAYCNPFVDRFSDRLLPPAEQIYPWRRAVLTQQAYATPISMLYESLVRASAQRFLIAHGEKGEADRQLLNQASCGFLWASDLSDLFGEYESARDQYPTFESFAPRVVEFFENLAATMPQRMARLPRVAAIAPENGATNVDPRVNELRIEFDRPMWTHSYAIMGQPGEVPELLGDGHFSPDARTFLQPIRLEPGRDYALRLNSPNHPGFVSADGVPLDEVDVTFKTAPR